MLRIATLSFGLLLSTLSLAADDTITCQRIAGEDKEVCFAYTDREAGAIDVQGHPELTQTASRNMSYRMTARVMIGSNACEADGMNAELTLAPDENGEASLAARVKGWKEIERVCDRDFQPVYQEVTLTVLRDSQGNYQAVILAD